MMDNFSKKGLYLSSLLHGLFFVILLVTFLVNSFVKQTTSNYVFQLERPSENKSFGISSQVVSKPSVASSAPKPIASSTPSKSNVKPVPQKIEKEGKVSYEDFVKKQKIAPSAKDSSMTKTVTSAVTQPISAPKIDASDLRKNLEQKFSVVQTSTVDEASGWSRIVGEYQAYVRSVIDSSWTQPEDFTGYKNSAIFEFDLDKLGNIQNVRVIKSSGSRVFDESIHQAFVKATSVRPTPDGKPLTGCRLSFVKRAKNLP